MDTTNPSTDPGVLVETATNRVLQLAATWLGWDGLPRWSEDRDRIYTPHKAIRRYGDHLIDHLAQIDCLLADVACRPDGWRASTATTEADFARFTEVDLNEATERLTRLATSFRLRLVSAGADAWDLPRGDAWTLREITEHVASPWYAEQVGDLALL